MWSFGEGSLRCWGSGLQVPRQRKPKGAYRFTSLLQKLQKWRMLITRALLELDKPADLPAEASDPLWAQNRAFGPLPPP